jgi:hypothetical protein
LFQAYYITIANGLDKTPSMHANLSTATRIRPAILPLPHLTQAVHAQIELLTTA